MAVAVASVLGLIVLGIIITIKTRDGTTKLVVPDDKAVNTLKPAPKPRRAVAPRTDGPHEVRRRSGSRCPAHVLEHRVPSTVIPVGRGFLPDPDPPIRHQAGKPELHQVGPIGRRAGRSGRAGAVRAGGGGGGCSVGAAAAGSRAGGSGSRG